MPFSNFDDKTHNLLRQAFDGALVVLEAINKEALSEERRAETVGQITKQLAEAAAEGEKDLSILQVRALEGIV